MIRVTMLIKIILYIISWSALVYYVGYLLKSGYVIGCVYATLLLFFINKHNRLR